MSLLEARGCSVCLNGHSILKMVDFTVDHGEMVGILGPNGAGKSTLIRVLAGLIPCSGVRFDGEELNTVLPLVRARRIAYLAQSVQAYWQVSCKDVVALGRMPHRSSAAEDEKIIMEALATMDVEHLSARIFNTLSGGERARVLLARALAVQGSVLLADEPIAHLDSSHQLRVLDLLRSRAAAGDAVVVVLHDLSLALRMCDRVCVLKQGEVVADGPPASVLNDELLASVFGISAVRGEKEGKTFLQPWGWIGS